jgi:hypothetical protein
VDIEINSMAIDALPGNARTLLSSPKQKILTSDFVIRDAGRLEGIFADESWSRSTRDVSFQLLQDAKPKTVDLLFD